MFTHKNYIYEIYTTGSFTTAAKKLFISQPALSATVKKLEEKIGAELFDRGSTPVRLTEVGKAYIESAEKIQAIEKNFTNQISDITELSHGSISIGGTSFICSCVLPEILKTFSTRYQGITINLIESYSEDLKLKVLAETLELVIDYDLDENFFKTYPLKQENVYLCGQKSIAGIEKLQDGAIPVQKIIDGNYQDYPILDISQLKNMDFLLLKKGNNMYKRATELFEDYDITPKTRLFLDQMKTSYELSRNGFGMTFVTDTLIEKSNYQDMLFFRLPEKYASRTAKIGHKKHAYISNCVEKFIQIAQCCDLT